MRHPGLLDLRARTHPPHTSSAYAPRAPSFAHKHHELHRADRRSRHASKGPKHLPRIATWMCATCTRILMLKSVVVVAQPTVNTRSRAGRSHRRRRRCCRLHPRPHQPHPRLSRRATCIRLGPLMLHFPGKVPLHVLPDYAVQRCSHTHASHGRHKNGLSSGATVAPPPAKGLATAPAAMPAGDANGLSSALLPGGEPKGLTTAACGIGAGGGVGAAP